MGDQIRGGELLDDFHVPSTLRETRAVRRRVVGAVDGLGLPHHRVEALETAVAEAVSNAIEHGNDSQPSLPVEVRVTADEDSVVVRVADQGRGGEAPAPDAPSPDLEAKLRGDQPARGWGLFLMRSLVDDVRVEHEGARCVVTLLMRRSSGVSRRPGP
jgi:serine/threonine-protein kinase RsbW